MGTNCVPLVADLFLLCFEGDLVLSLSYNNQVIVITVFNFLFLFVKRLHSSLNIMSLVAVRKKKK